MDPVPAVSCHRLVAVSALILAAKEAVAVLEDWESVLTAARLDARFERVDLFDEAGRDVLHVGDQLRAGQSTET